MAVRCHVVVCVAFLGVAFLLPACRTLPSPSAPDAAPISAPGAADADALLDLEYRIAYAEWREEVRWSDFFSAIYSTHSVSGPEVLEHLDVKDRTKIVDDMIEVMFRSNIAMANLVYMEHASEEGRRKYMRDFVEDWRVRGPRSRKARVQLCLDFVEKVWKADKDAQVMKFFEAKYPEVPLLTPKTGEAPARGEGNAQSK